MRRRPGRCDGPWRRSILIGRPSRPTAFVDILNRRRCCTCRRVAVAIGFRMNLFNIGVEGQYRLAALRGGRRRPARHWLPGVLAPVLAILVAMLVGAAWAGIAGVLKVDPRRQRGDLDDHAERDRGRPGRLPAAQGRGPGASGSNIIETTPIGPSGRCRMPSITFGDAQTRDLRLPLRRRSLVGVGVLVHRSAAPGSASTCGHRPDRATAAIASGVNVKRMTLVAMLISGGVAGLVGLPTCSARRYTFSQTFAVGTRLRRHRHRAAGAQLTRSAWRWRRCCGPSSASRPTSCRLHRGAA